MHVLKFALATMAMLTQVSAVQLDVTSVRVVESADTGSFAMPPQLLPGRLVVRNASLPMLAARAYQLPALPGPTLELLFVGMPESVRALRFDVEATLRPADARLSWDEWSPFLLQILQTRFGWRAHTEQRELPVYALRLATPGQFGPRLRRRDEPCNETRSNCRVATDVLPGGGIHTVNHGEMARIALLVQGWKLDRIVVDQTGLTGDFDWELTHEVVPDASLGGGQRYPTIWDALEDDLGLLVVSTEAPMEVVVVDAVSLPAQN